MTFCLKIIRGDNAHQIRCTPEFISEWQTLANNTMHVTVFQEPAFVNCWYQQYSPEFEPIIVCGFDQYNQLIGLLPLAIEKTSHALSHAAAQQVEYSGWLCLPDYQNTFISQAIALVHNEVTFSAWKWSHIPPRAEVNWLLEPGKDIDSLHFHYEKIASPILDLNNEEKIKKIKKSKSLKSKINRLKRKGDLHLEHITDPDRANEVMQLVPDLVNFRHGAAHGDLAFREDPLQHGFYQSRANNLTENHFSALWMGDILLAFHFGGIDKDTIYIGLTAFDPRESKHSPGVVFILYLAEMVQQQGIRYIDLTPGGDEYKERFCNDHQTLYQPIIYSSRMNKHLTSLKKKTKAHLISALSSIGIEKQTIASKFESIKEQINPVNNYNLYSLYLDNINPETHNDSVINIQKYNDLLIHQGYSDSLEMQSILSDATQRFSKEETLYTLMNNNKLIGYSWLSKTGAKYRNHNLELEVEKDAAVINIFEVENAMPNNDTLKTMLNYTVSHAAQLNITKLYSFIPAKANPETIKLYENLGFQTDDLQ